MLTVKFKSGTVVGPIYVGQQAPWKYEDVSDIIEAQADGHELAHIEFAYPHLMRKVSGKSVITEKEKSFTAYSPVQRWFGPDAQYAASCWKTPEFSRPIDLPEPINRVFSDLYKELSDAAIGKSVLTESQRKVIYIQLRCILENKEQHG